jgi:D-alanyl-D-alanine dipeptidase
MELVEDDERGGHPKSTRSEVNIAAVADLVKNDLRIASRMIADSLNIPKTVVLRIPKEDVRESCVHDFFLLHDNAPAHKSTSVCQFLTPKNVTTLYHLPYSPDLSPPDYFLFPRLKMKLGLHFEDVAEIQEDVTDELKKVQKQEFSAAFRKLYDRAKACIYANGAYFEFKKSYVSSSCVFDF